MVDSTKASGHAAIETQPATVGDVAMANAPSTGPSQNPAPQNPAPQNGSLDTASMSLTDGGVADDLVTSSGNDRVISGADGDVAGDLVTSPGNDRAISRADVAATVSSTLSDVRRKVLGFLKTRGRDTPDFLIFALIALSFVSVLAIANTIRHVTHQRTIVNAIAHRDSDQAILAQRITDASAGMDAFAAKALVSGGDFYTQNIKLRVAALPKVVNSVLTEKGKLPSNFEERRIRVLDRLRRASENASGTDQNSKERQLLLNMQLGVVDYLVQLQAADGLRNEGKLVEAAEAYVSAVDAMDRTILPSASAFENVTGVALLNTLNRHRDSTSNTVGWLGGLCGFSVVLLVALQLFLFRRTNRTLNPALLLATLLVVLFMLATIGSVSRSKDGVSNAKSAFARVNNLRLARSKAYIANANERRSLLLPEEKGYSDTYEQAITDVVGSTEVAGIVELAKWMESGGYGSYDGLLGSFVQQPDKGMPDRVELVKSVNALADYVTIHGSIVGLSIDDPKFASTLTKQDKAFERFLGANDKAIEVNKKQFDADMSNALANLDGFATKGWLVLVGLLSLIVIGLLPRINEYRG